jgi:hypothetical protein
MSKTKQEVRETFERIVVNSNIQRVSTTEDCVHVRMDTMLTAHAMNKLLEKFPNMAVSGVASGDKIHVTVDK